MAFIPRFHSVPEGAPDLKGLYGWKRTLLVPHQYIWEEDAEDRTIDNYDLDFFASNLATLIASEDPDEICINLEGPEASWYFEAQGVQRLIDSHQALAALAKRAQQETNLPITAYRPPLRVAPPGPGVDKTVTNRRRLYTHIKPDGESPFDYLDFVTGEAYVLESFGEFDLSDYLALAVDEIRQCCRLTGKSTATAVPWVWDYIHPTTIAGNPEGDAMSSDDFSAIVTAFRDAGFGGVNWFRYKGASSPREWDSADDATVALINSIAGIA